MPDASPSSGVSLPGPSTATERAASAASPLEVMGPQARAVILDTLADALDAEAGRLVGIADRETSLGTTKLSGEVARTTGQLRLFGEVLRDGEHPEVTNHHADPSVTPPRPDLRRRLEPLGLVTVFTGNKFPRSASRRRPVPYQNMAETLLPAALRDDNPSGVSRRVNGRLEVWTPQSDRAHRVMILAERRKDQVLI